MENEEDSSDDSESDEINDDNNAASHDNIDEKLINFKSPNLLNQMLPYANGNATAV